MTTFPNSLEEAIAQAKEATLAALADGYKRIQIEIVIPEIALQAPKLALEFTSLFEEYGSRLKVIFPDTGAAALARRDWGEVPFKINDLGSRISSVERKVEPEDELYLLVSPSSVEVDRVEKLCELAGDRPVVLLIPQLEDVYIVGIGYAARQLRERFITTLQSCYYLKPLEEVTILRSYPSAWQIWLEKEDGYELVAEEAEKPVGDKLDLILAKVTGGGEAEDSTQSKPKKRGILASVQQFLRALSQ